MTELARARSTAVVGFLVAGGLGVLSATQTWLTVARADGTEAIPVTGGQSLALLTPLSLAVLALGAALAIVGPVLRYVFAALGLLVAGLLGWSTLELLLTAPLSAVAPTVTQATGLAGDDALASLIESIRPSGWPVAALVGWVVLLAAAVFTIVTARRWKRGGRRFRTDAPTGGSGPVDAVDSWDDLSRGADPTR